MTTEGEWAELCNRLIEERKALEAEIERQTRERGILAAERDGYRLKAEAVTKDRNAISRLIETMKKSSLVACQAAYKKGIADANQNATEYRKALEYAYEALKGYGCDCGTDEPGTCGECYVKAFFVKKEGQQVININPGHGYVPESQTMKYLLPGMERTMAEKAHQTAQEAANPNPTSNPMLLTKMIERGQRGKGK